jgi:hypothetical protein
MARTQRGGGQIKLPGRNLAESIVHRCWGPSRGRGKLLVWNMGGAIQVHPFLNGSYLECTPSLPLVNMTITIAIAQ